MTARIGADDVVLFSAPQPDVLRQISGIEPEAAETHVFLGPYGVQSTQRLALGDVGGGLVAGLWPAELKTQAEYLYGLGLATPMIAAARRLGWTAEPSPHIGFWNSAPDQRLYMSPSLDAAEYAHRWQTGDLRRVRQYEPAEVRTTLWPWLKERGYASAVDDEMLERFLTSRLKKRPAHMRPGLRLKRRWDAETIRGLGGRRAVAAAIRGDVNAILAAAGEPPLPSSRPLGSTGKNSR